MASITISGLEQFRTDLERLDFSKQKDLLVKAGLEAAEPLRLTISEEAPVRTGRLSRDIQKQEDRQQSSIDSVTIEVGPSRDTFYGIFQEFGTAFHAAQPFVEPAIEESAFEVEQAFVEALNRAIARA